MLYDKALKKFSEVRDAIVFDIENVAQMFFDSDQQYCDLSGIMRILRENAGYSQKEMATMLKISPAAVSAYEIGTRNISLNVLVRYSRIFGFKAGYILIDG